MLRIDVCFEFQKRQLNLENDFHPLFTEALPNAFYVDSLTCKSKKQLMRFRTIQCPLDV